MMSVQFSNYVARGGIVAAPDPNAGECAFRGHGKPKYIMKVLGLRVVSVGVIEPEIRIFRGACWGNIARYRHFLSALRGDADKAEHRSFFAGFRLVYSFPVRQSVRGGGYLYGGGRCSAGARFGWSVDGGYEGSCLGFRVVRSV